MRHDLGGNWQRRFMHGPKGGGSDTRGPTTDGRGPRRAHPHGPATSGSAGADSWQTGERDGGRRGGRGGGGRFFDHGELRQVVLALLGEQPRHGYDIIRAVEQRTGGTYAPSPGVIYPTLQLLEDIGHVIPASPEGTRNLYQITDTGRAFLDDHKARIGDIMHRMARAGRKAKAPPTVVAAMDNLKSALRSAGDEPWSETEAGRIAAAIDSAAHHIRSLRQDPEKTGAGQTSETK